MKRLLLLFAGMLLGTQVLLAQLTVNVTNPTNTTPNMQASYASFAAALDDLNLVSAMSGPITLTLQTGSETAPIKGFVIGSASLNGAISAANTITINTAGGTVTINAGVGTSNGGTATPDGMLVLNGADYITIDGITFTDGNATDATESMEFGIGLFKLSVGDGCNNNTIQNCIFNMQRLNHAVGSGALVNGSVGIGIYNSTYTAATTALTPTNGGTLYTNGTNSENNIYSNSFNGGNYGIVIIGYAATVGVGPNPDINTFLGDVNNDIGGSSAPTGNSILNFGGGASATNPSAGIRVNSQWGVNISYNTVNNNNGTGVNHVSTLRGIYAQTATSAAATINNNSVTIKGGGTTSQVAAIESGLGATPNGNTVSISNNTVTGEYLTATSGVFYGIYSISATPATLNIQNNSVNGWNYSASGLTGSGAVYPIYTTGSNAGTTINATGNTVNNITRTGTTGGTTIGIFLSAGTTGMVVNANNNTVTNMSIDGTGTSSTMYGMQTSTGTISMNNNQINSLSCIKTTGTGTLYGIYNGASPVDENYNNNTVHTLTHNGTGTVYGIYVWSTTGTRTMSGNLVYNLSTGGTTIAGLHNISSSPVIYNNKIYNITSTSTGAPTVSGILQGSLGTAGFANIYNNFIGDLKAPAANTSSATSPSVRGINITTTTTSSNVRLFYNTVYLNAASTGTNFGTTALFATTSTTSTTANLTLKNNIFVNNSTPAGTGLAVAYQRSSTALNNYDNSSNNNLFYAGTPGASNLIFYDGTNSDQTIADFKTRVLPRETSSFTENPTFVSTVGSSNDFLKIDLTVPTQIESGGQQITTPVAITTDYFATIRALETGYLGTGTAPDIGAYEGEMVGLDLSPPLIAYTALANTSGTAARNLTVTVTDASGVPVVTPGWPNLYWRINAGSWTAATPTNVTGSNYTYSLGAGVVTGDVVQYYVVAQDNAGTPNVGAFPSAGAAGFTTNPPAAATPPTTPSSYTIVGSLAGTYSVGTGQTYETLTAAITDLNGKEVTGAVVFELWDATYPAETFPITIASVPGLSATNTVTIKPKSGVTAEISGAPVTNSPLIIINGNYITFDGSNTTGGTSRDLSVINTLNTGTVTSAGSFAINGSNVTVSNLIAKAAASTNGYGILVAGGNSVTIRNCAISRTALGVQSQNAASNFSVIGCEIGSDVVNEHIQNNGLVVLSTNGFLVENNTIRSIMRTGTATVHGISIAQETSGINPVNGLIQGNRIFAISNSGTGFSAYGARGISLSSPATNANITVVNNVIYDIFGFGDGSTTGLSWTPHGIYIAQGGGYNIYFNSVSLTGDLTYSGTSAIRSCALAIETSVTVGSLDIRNNVFSNSQTFDLATGVKAAHAIYSGNANTTFTNINYNDYFVSGAAGVLGYLGANQADLTAWQTATTQDANSISANPLFTTATNLAPQAGSPLLFAGTNIPAVTEDFNGYGRNNPPTIGAYEYEGTSTGPVVLLGGTDAASNYGGIWNNGSNQGYGFGAWTLTANQGSGFAGHFLGDPAGAGITGMPNPSFGLYANPGGSGASANADRTLVAPLPVGGTLSFDWGVNWDSDVAGGNKGFNLYTGGTSGTQIINVNMANSGAITINGNPMFNNYGTQKMTLSFQYQSAGNLRVFGTGRDGSESYDQVIAVAGAPDALRFYASGLNGGDQRQPYFNNFNIVTSTTGVLATSSVQVKGRVLLNNDIAPSHLFIGSGHILNVNPTVDVTVSGNLSNSAGNAGLVLASDATGTASLIHNTNDVAATVNRYLTGNATLSSKHYHQVSFPLNADITTAEFTGSYLWKWDYATQAYVSFGPGTDNNLPNDQGYLAFYPGASVTYDFAGQLNNGTFDVPLGANNADFTLAPNPYPSAINWNTGAGWTRTNLEGTYWIWSPLDGNYANYNGTIGTLGATEFIPAGQAFFVKANAGSPVLQLNNNARVHSNQAYLNTDQISNMLRVTARANNFRDEMIVYFDQEAQITVDVKDATKLLGAAEAPQLYSTAVGSEQLSINVLPYAETTVIVPVGFEISETTETTLYFDGLQSFAQDVTIFLEDKMTNEMLDLRLFGQYTFQHNTGNDPDRFNLHFFGVTGVDDVNANGSYQIWSNDRKVYVNIPELNGQRAGIEMFDVLGSRIFSSEGVMNSPAVVRAANSGVAIIRVTAQGRVYTTKLFIQ